VNVHHRVHQTHTSHRGEKAVLKSSLYHLNVALLVSQHDQTQKSQFKQTNTSKKMVGWMEFMPVDRLDEVNDARRKVDYREGHKCVHEMIPKTFGFD